MKTVYRRHGGEPREALVESVGPDEARVETGGLAADFIVKPLGDGRFRMTSGERSWHVCVDREGSARHVTVLGVGEARFEREHGGRTRSREAAPGGLSSQMPGTVAKVLVAPGDVVSEGQTLLIVEAMKMEIKISSPIDGTVGAVHVAAGDPCDAGEELARVDAAEERA